MDSYKSVTPICLCFGFVAFPEDLDFVVMIGKEEDYEVNTHNSRSTAQFLLLKQNRDSSFTKEVL